MNKKEIEQRFDERFGIEEFIGDDFDETQFVLNNCRTTEEALSFFFDEILPEVLKDLQFTERDIQLVGEHYWDGDYSPTHRERDGVAQSMNYQLQNKVREKYNITL